MRRLLFQTWASSRKASDGRRVASRHTRARVQVEGLEGRELLTAMAAPVPLPFVGPVASNTSGTSATLAIASQSTSLSPKNLLIYYGYPSAINGASSLSQVANTIGSYADVVLGDTLEDPSHPDHQNTVAILANPATSHTLVFGYVDLGVSTQNLSINEIENRINQWKTTGAKGIFLDDFGYDFGTTRARQDTVVQYAHSLGLVVTANAFDPADAFGTKVDPAHNPSGMKTALNAGDYYLYESFQVEEGSYVPASDWEAKSQALATYQSSLGFKVLATTTNNAANAFNQTAFNYAWASALLDGYSAVGWGEYDFAAVTCQVPTRPTPTVNAGTTYTGSVVVNGSTLTRNTDLGQIAVNTTTHTATFTTLPAAPTLTAKAVSATQVNLSWTPVGGATGYVIDELIAGVWRPIASLGKTSTAYTVSGLAAGSPVTLAVGATIGAMTVFSAAQTIQTFTSFPTLTGMAASTTQINLAWTGVLGASAYEVDELIGGVWQPIKTLKSPNTTLSVIGLQHGVAYTFRVGAIDAAGKAFSSSKTIVTK